ncbi:MAG: hypothetical protein DMG77_16455 [Acidobacteria bacterium]|nr:MAG: hypothetical protein DMG77_16455 [Acidobacteriota bacterium]
MMKFYRQGAWRILAGQKILSTAVITVAAMYGIPLIRKMLTLSWVGGKADWARRFGEWGLWKS